MRKAIRRFLLLAETFCLLALAGLPSVQAGPEILPGYQLYQTLPAADFMGASFHGMPLHTYDFGGSLGVQPVMFADTIWQRLDTATAPETPVSTQLLALHLQSDGPVSLPWGFGTYFIRLQSERGGAPSVGSMDIVFGPEGHPHGSFTSEFTLNYDVYLGDLSTLVFSGSTTLSSLAADWDHDAAFIRPPPWRRRGLDFKLDGTSTEADFWMSDASFEETGPDLTLNWKNYVCYAPAPPSLVLGILGTLLAIGARHWPSRSSARSPEPEAQRGPRQSC